MSALTAEQIEALALALWNEDNPIGTAATLDGLGPLAKADALEHARTVASAIDRAHMQIVPVEAIVATPGEHAAHRAQVERVVALLCGMVVLRAVLGTLGVPDDARIDRMFEVVGAEANELLEQLAPEARHEAADRDAFVVALVAGHMRALVESLTEGARDRTCAACGVVGFGRLAADGRYLCTDPTGKRFACGVRAVRDRHSCPGCGLTHQGEFDHCEPCRVRMRQHARGFMSVGLMVLIAVICVVGSFTAALCGCSAAPGPVFVSDDAGELAAPADARDAGESDAQGAAALDGAVDANDAADAAADAPASVALCCSTSQGTVQPCDPAAPFTCTTGRSGARPPGACNAACAVGDGCGGPDGLSVVVLCDGGDQ